MPFEPTRRQFIASLAAAASLPRVLDAQSPTRVRLLLNSGFSGPQAFMFLAEDRGYLKDAGVEVEFVGGDGASAIVPRILPGQFDAGYGDMNALIEQVARDSAAAPIGVYCVFNTTPLTIAVAASSPIRTARDLEGRRIGGHPMDAALKYFPAYARKAGIDASKVTIVPSTSSMRALVETTLAGKTDGTFGFVNTIVAAITPAGINARRRLRFLEYRNVAPDLYGHTLMVTRAFAREHPQAVAGMVRAFNRGLADTVKDINAAISSVARREPSMTKAIDKTRLQGTLDVEMSHPEGARIGVGDVDERRLARSIMLIADTLRLPRLPTVPEVFTRQFLPPDAERIRTLARPATGR